MTDDSAGSPSPEVRFRFRHTLAHGVAMTFLGASAPFIPYSLFTIAWRANTGERFLGSNAPSVHLAIFVLSLVFGVYFAKRIRRTTATVVGVDHLTSPRFGNPHIALSHITAAQVGPDGKRVLVGVRDGVVRSVPVGQLDPVISAQHFVDALHQRLRVGASESRTAELTQYEGAATQMARRPLATMLLTLLLVACFGWFQFNQLTEQSLTFLLIGGMSTPLVIDGEWWRLLTPVLLHAGLLHLCANAASTLLVGWMLEGLIGSRALVAMFVLTALLGDATSILLVGSYDVGVGASAGAMGLFGAAVYLIFAEPIKLPPAVNPYSKWVVAIGTALSIYPLHPSINWVAHLGGFIAGALLCHLLFRTARWNNATGLKPHQFVVVLFWLSTLALGAATAKVCWDISRVESLRADMVTRVINDARFAPVLVNAVAWHALAERKELPGLWAIAARRIAAPSADHLALYNAAGLFYLTRDRDQAARTAMRGIDRAPANDVPDIAARLAFIEISGAPLTSRGVACVERHFVEFKGTRPAALLRQPLDAAHPGDDPAHALRETFFGATPFSKCLTAPLRTAFNEATYRDATRDLVPR